MEDLQSKSNDSITQQTTKHVKKPIQTSHFKIDYTPENLPTHETPIHSLRSEKEEFNFNDKTQEVRLDFEKENEEDGRRDIVTDNFIDRNSFARKRRRKSKINQSSEKIITLLK